MYGDFIYNTDAMKKSQDALSSKTNISLRAALSDMENLLAKTYFLVENGEASRSELRKIYNYSGKLLSLLDDFKYNIMR